MAARRSRYYRFIMTILSSFGHDKYIKPKAHASKSIVQAIRISKPMTYCAIKADEIHNGRSACFVYDNAQKCESGPIIGSCKGVLC